MTPSAYPVSSPILGGSKSSLTGAGGTGRSVLVLALVLLLGSCIPQSSAFATVHHASFLTRSGTATATTSLSLNTKDDVSDSPPEEGFSINNFLVKRSCGIQLWLNLHPNSITRFLLSCFYVLDLIPYSAFGAKEFLLKRTELIGPNFASLGRLFVGEYAKTAEIISSHQQRGNYLGRARLYPDKVAKDFLLFLSDQDAGGTDLHSVLHNGLWETLMPAAMNRLSDPAFDKYISETVAITSTMSKEKKAVFPEVQKLTIRYVFHAIFGTPLTDSQVEVLLNLFFSGNPTLDYVFGAVKPFGALLSLLQGGRSKAIAELEEIILQSPAMADYVPSESNAFKSKEEYAELLLALAGIAGLLGSSALCLEVLIAIPDDYPIDLDSRQEVTLAVLEAARMRPPVNNVNVILSEDKELTIKGRSYVFPPGTVAAASIGLASFDPNVFEAPYEFNPKRDNLVQSGLNFNHVGFDPEGAGTRQCPGRNVAMKFATDVLIESRKKQGVPPTKNPQSQPVGAANL
jgi:cytochrome P450